MSAVPSSVPAPKGNMPTTEWTLVARLQSGNEVQARAALDELCRAYHYPLYGLIRRRGLDHHDAEDALHDFLAKLVRHDTFGVADREKGRLRTFLSMALQRFLSNWRRDQYRKRGREVSADAEAAIAEAEGRYEKEEAGHHESPDLLYDRQWAQELMRLVMQRVRARYEAKGKLALFDSLCPVLLSGGSLIDHDSARLAAELNMRPGAMRTALMRLLRDYQEALRHEIHQTVEDREMARLEFQVLMAAFQQK
jgi:DNA-directed RNA polymerase specialized sigma24 family protein